MRVLVIVMMVMPMVVLMLVVVVEVLTSFGPMIQAVLVHLFPLLDRTERW
jgi:hypothetical protein